MRIEDMSIDQLLELNQYICQRIDELQEQETLQALSQLRVGLKVTFEVSPELLRPLRDVK